VELPGFVQVSPGLSRPATGLLYLYLFTSGFLYRPLQGLKRPEREAGISLSSNVKVTSSWCLITGTRSNFCFPAL